METTPQVVLISRQVPPEISRFLQGYLIEAGESLMLFARSFEEEGYFVALTALAIDGGGKSRRIRVPVQIVLASADATDQQKTQFGFS